MGSFDAAWNGTLYLFGGVVVHFDDSQREALREFVVRTQRLQWPGILLLAWTSKRIFGALFGALESIFGIQGGFFRGHLVAFAMVLLTGVALFVTLALTTVIATVDGLIARALGPHAPTVVHDFTAFLLAQGLPALIAFAFFFVVYRLMPRRHVNNRNALAGALLATVLWELAKAGFAYYVRNLAHYAGLYGALEAILVLGLWLEVSVSVILFCAEVVALLVAIPQPTPAVVPEPAVAEPEPASPEP
jgi:membrane protein